MKLNVYNMIFKSESKSRMEKLKCARYVEGSKKKKKKKKRERDLLNQIFYRTAIEDTFLMISWDKIALL